MADEDDSEKQKNLPLRSCEMRVKRSICQNNGI